MKLIDVQAEALGWLFMLYCRYVCGNRVKLFLVGEKTDKRVGYPLMPYLCSRCSKLNPEAVDVYKRIGRWEA